MVENSTSSRYESNDNVALAHTSPGTMNTFSLSTSLAASRKTESAATVLNGVATALHQQGPAAQDRVDGQLGLTQSLGDALNDFTLGVLYLQDFNDLVSSADVAVGRGRRRTRSLSGGWTRSLSERLSAHARLSTDRTGYGQQAGAVDFRNADVSLGLSYRLTQADALSLDAGRSDYRTQDGSNRSTTDQLNVGVSRALSERNSASLSLGSYRTKTEALSSRVFCPLVLPQFPGCAVPLQVVTEPSRSTGRGLQFNLSDTYQFNETTVFSFGAARKQAPSGAGAVVRSDTLTASASHSFSPTLSGVMNYAQSRSAYQGLVGSAQPSQKSFSLSLSRQLATDLSVQASYQYNRAQGGSVGSARSNSVSVSLSYDWPKLGPTH